MIIVVDASVAIKWFEQEVDSDKAAQVLAGDHLLIAPAHAFGEIGEVLSRQVRRGLIGRDQIEASLMGLQRSLTSVPLDELLSESVAITLEAGTSFYDALYVAAAVRWRASLVTSDEKLIRALVGTRWHASVRRLVDFEAAP